MYQILDMQTGETVGVVREIRYVKRNPFSGAWIESEQSEAECISVNGARYSIEGRQKIRDAPYAVVRVVDAARVLRDKALNGDVDELRSAYVDLADAVLDIYTDIRGS